MGDKEHDHLVRAVFGRSEEAAAHLRAFPPGEILERLDLSRLDLVPTSFVDQHHRLSEVDLLFRIETTGRETYVYMLMEHQSSAQRFMALRLLSYLVAIWEWWKANHAKARHLPVILPIVLHHGRQPWKAPRKLSELLDADAALLAQLSPLIPELCYWVTDLAVIGDRELLERTAAFAPLAALTVFLLKNGRDPNLPAMVPLLTQPLRRLLDAPAGREDLGLLVNYLDRIREASSMDDVIEAMSEVGDDAVVDISKTRGYIQREEGARQGRLEALRESLVAFLVARFGAIPPSIGSRIQTSEAEDLRAWISLAATAPDAESAFLGPTPRS